MSGSLLARRRRSSSSRRRSVTSSRVTTIALRLPAWPRARSRASTRRRSPRPCHPRVAKTTMRLPRCRMSSRDGVGQRGRSLSMARSGRNRPSVGPSGRSHSARAAWLANSMRPWASSTIKRHRDGLGERSPEGGIGQVDDRVRFPGPGRQRPRRGDEPRQLRIVGLVDHVDGEGADALGGPHPVGQLAAPPGCRCQRRGSNASRRGRSSGSIVAPEAAPPGRCPRTPTSGPRRSSTRPAPSSSSTVSLR